MLLRLPDVWVFHRDFREVAPPWSSPWMLLKIELRFVFFARKYRISAPNLLRSLYFNWNNNNKKKNRNPFASTKKSQLFFPQKSLHINKMQRYLIRYINTKKKKTIPDNQRMNIRYREMRGFYILRSLKKRKNCNILQRNNLFFFFFRSLLLFNCQWFIMIRAIMWKSLLYFFGRNSRQFSN